MLIGAGGVLLQPGDGHGVLPEESGGVCHVQPLGFDFRIQGSNHLPDHRPVRRHLPQGTKGILPGLVQGTHFPIRQGTEPEGQAFQGRQGRKGHGIPRIRHAAGHLHAGHEPQHIPNQGGGAKGGTVL